MYTLLTTCPPYGSRNVGDKLIEQSIKDLVAHETGVTEFLTIFREEPLEPYLEEINGSRAVLATMGLRNTSYHVGWAIIDAVDQIRVPIIPVGSNWNAYPGDARSRRDFVPPEENVAFVRRIADQLEQWSCREYHACRMLEKLGVENTLMTGDPAWFHLPSLGKPMRRPAGVERVAFSPPLSPFYVHQGEQMMRMLASFAPQAERICAMHLVDAGTAGENEVRSERSAAMTPAVARKNRRIRELADELGFRVCEMAGDLSALDLYDTCDLHVGYECHAHVSCISRRIPSVLIAEDARGVGFNYTLGVGGFNGFVRTPGSTGVVRKEITSGYCTSLEEFAMAPARGDVHEEVHQFLLEELSSGFRRYVGLASYLDRLYQEVMGPFIRSLR